MPRVRRRHKEVRKGPRLLGPESFKIEEMHREPTFLSPWYSSEREEEAGSVRETGSIKTPVKVFLLPDVTPLFFLYVHIKLRLEEGESSSSSFRCSFFFLSVDFEISKNFEKSITRGV